MPSFDGGHYQLTALIPLRQERENGASWDWKRGPSSEQTVQRPGSVADSLRELLSSFRSVDVPDLETESAAEGRVARAIPFSGNDRTHFARLVVVEHLAYNGRQNGDTLIDMFRGFAQPWLPAALRLKMTDEVDHLPRPYLLILIDFDSPDGSRESVEKYLLDLWGSMQQEWAAILKHCHGFTQAEERQAASYVDLILHHEIESNFSYAIYPWGAERARRWQPTLGKFRSRRSANRSGLLFGYIGIPLLELLVAMLLIALLGRTILFNPWFIGLSLFALALKPLVWHQFLRRANEPWPALEGTDLRSVLKALFLQNSLLHMLETWQQRSVAGSPSLLSHFRHFLDVTRPHDLQGPTLKAGSVHHRLRRRPNRNSSQP